MENKLEISVAFSARGAYENPSITAFKAIDVFVFAQTPPIVSVVEGVGTVRAVPEAAAELKTTPLR